MSSEQVLILMLTHLQVMMETIKEAIAGCPKCLDEVMCNYDGSQLNQLRIELCMAQQYEDSLEIEEKAEKAAFWDSLDCM